MTSQSFMISIQSFYLFWLTWCQSIHFYRHFQLPVKDADTFRCQVVNVIPAAWSGSSLSWMCLHGEAFWSDAQTTQTGSFFFMQNGSFRCRASWIGHARIRPEEGILILDSQTNSTNWQKGSTSARTTKQYCHFLPSQVRSIHLASHVTYQKDGWGFS